MQNLSGNHDSEDDRDAVLKRAHEIADHYSLSTGVDVRIISEVTKPQDICSCCLISGSENNAEKCLEKHLISADLAERFGGSYIYFCGSSLLFWSSPIIYEGKMIASFSAGPALIVSREEIFSEWKKNGIPVSEDIEMLDKIPVITPEQSRSLAELLLMCAGWVNERSDHLLIESRQYQNQQAKISEYIHQLKGESTDNVSAYPIELEAELAALISQGKNEQAQKVLNKILGNVIYSGGNRIELILLRVTELIVIMSRAAIDGGADRDEVFNMNYKYISQLDKNSSADTLSYWLSKVLNDYSRLVFDISKAKHVGQLERTLHYINSNYTEKITLEAAADHAALSPAYFSKIFKDEIGISFTRYINQLRVSHSKTLLKTTTFTLIEISGLVGFDDQSYFSRIFKQETGVSPGKYREKSYKWKKDSPEIHS